MTRIPRTLAALAGLAAVLSAAACGSAEMAPSAPKETAESAVDWPRTVEVDGADIEISAPPTRIVALSTETGDLALQLVGPDRVAAVSSGSVAEGAGNQIALAEQVETVLRTGTSPDPEQILALDPDLVLITERHDGEQDAADLLESTGVASIAFDSDDFATIDAVMASARTLGEALGADAEAEGIVADMAERRADVETHLGDATPRVLLLMARGGQQMIQPASTLMAHLVEEAGGEVVGAGKGAVPADPERIVDVDPDVIIVEDFRGAGVGPFQEMLSSAALADVAAVSRGEVHVVSGAIASSTAGTRAVDGLEEIASLLHG